MTLTKRKVDAAKPKKKGGEPERTVTWDKKVPAFGVRSVGCIPLADRPLIPLRQVGSRERS